MEDTVGTVGVPDIHDGEIVAVIEDGDSVSVVLRRRWHDGRPATRATPDLQVRFTRVKDVVSRAERWMIVQSLAEKRGEPPWRRFVFTKSSAAESGSFLEIWAQGVEWSDVVRRPCPCCGYRTLDESAPGSYEICPVCGWEDDIVQSTDPRYRGGANRKSLDEARADFLEDVARHPGRDKDLSREWGPPG